MKKMIGLAVTTALTIFSPGLTPYARGQEAALPRISPPACEKPPLIDGDLSDACWATAARVDKFHIFGSNGKTSSNVVARLVRDTEWLYVSFEIIPPNPEAIRAVARDHDGGISADDSVEIFFNPGTSGNFYYHYVLNAANFRAEQKCQKIPDKDDWRKHKDNAWDLPWRSATRITKAGWQAEIGIPFVVLAGQDDLSSATINLCANWGTNTRNFANVVIANSRENLSWAPVKKGFHEPSSFGQLSGLDAAKSGGSGLPSGLDSEPFLVAVQEVKAGSYVSDEQGRSFYEISGFLRSHTGHAGKVMLIAVDKPATGKGESVSREIEIRKAGDVPFSLKIPVSGFPERTADIFLRNPASGEILENVFLRDMPKLRLMRSRSQSPAYFTTNTEAFIACEISLPVAELKKAFLIAKDKAGQKLSEMGDVSALTMLPVPMDRLHLGANQVAVELRSKSGDSLYSQEEAWLIKREPMRNPSESAPTPVLETSGFTLSPAHMKAVERRRRIIVQYDACDPQQLLGGDLPASIPYRFDYIDEGGTHIDSIIWDIGFGSEAIWPSKVLHPNVSEPFVRWRTNGVDFVGTLVAETHRRGLEAFWNHRINELDIAEKLGLEMYKLSPEKAAYQDWVLKSWWWQGMWNLAEPGLRRHKVASLRELAELYDFDGFQIDFARVTPCLPVGRQWEMRDHATEFMRMVRAALLEVEAKRGRPILLSAKVPENLEGCRADGFDVETWMRLNLVDMLSLGSRSMDVDVAAFRRLSNGSRIKLYPCLDDAHSTDGYVHPPIEFFRGVFGNWWHQGADGVETFNWSCARSEVRDKVGGGWNGCESHRQAYHECGDSAMMKGKDKMFAAERRGGYPYAEGYFNQNLLSPLPTQLAYDGRPTSLRMRMCDDLSSADPALAEVTLLVTVFDAKPGDLVTAAVNGIALDAGKYDFNWKDSQIFSPLPQPISGYTVIPPVNPNQKLLQITFKVPPKTCRLGENTVDLRSAARAPHLLSPLQIEKVEILVRYKQKAD